MSTDGITIVIADDHPIFLRGLQEILEDEADFRIVGEFHEGEGALACIRSLKPDVAVLDIEMPNLSGLDIAAIIQRDHISTGVIILTISNRFEIFRRAIDFGVVGYILKDSAAEDLVAGIRRILQGGYHFSPSLAVSNVDWQHGPETPPHLASGLAALTPTERKVLAFISENKSGADIARILSISTRTVEKHRTNIAEKLSLHGSYALVRFALQNRQLL